MIKSVTRDAFYCDACGNQIALTSDKFRGLLIARPGQDYKSWHACNWNCVALIAKDHERIEDVHND